MGVGFIGKSQLVCRSNIPFLLYIIPNFLISQAFYQKCWYFIGMNEIRFAENLKALRVAKGLTQAELAERLGVSQRTVSAWETKVCRPDYETLARICSIFDESFEDMLL